MSERDDIVRNVCGRCDLGIHQAVTRDGKASWVHDERTKLVEWMTRGGGVHAPVPANLSGPVTDKEEGE